MSLFKTPPPGGLDADGVKRQKAQQIADVEERLHLVQGLPFLHGWKWYPWARAFYESTNHVSLLCAANQISKSSTQIRKCLNWASNTGLWASLWADRPIQFWYLYPSQKVVNAEWATKWKQFLPQNGYENDPVYGWKVIKEKQDILGIEFNTGVYLYFKTYTQHAQDLQTGTCDAIFCDEELPFDLYDELKFRLASTNGYFHMVFTATLGQEEWRKAMEPEEGEEEGFPHAFKQTVSLYDSMRYEDGTPSKWTKERIQQVESSCSTALEVLKRVYGRFVMVGGRKYEAFDIKRHMKPRHPVPKNWLIYAGSDPGSGGEKNHPAALCYVAVSPDFRKGRVFLAWRGDGIETTSGDCVQKHIDIVKENSLQLVEERYDWGAKDFEIISRRMGRSFQKADKSHESGEQVINTLFKNNMMYLYDGDPEIAKLAAELATLKKCTNKRKAKDNLADAFRYCVTTIPWDWSVIIGEMGERPEADPTLGMNEFEKQVHERRKQFDDPDEIEKRRIEEEFEELNDFYGD